MTGHDMVGRRVATGALRRRVVVALVAATLTTAGCTGAQTPAPDSTAVGPPRECKLDALATPECGLIWGVAAKPPGIKSIQAIEAQVGRSLDMAYRYHDLYDTIPDEKEREVLAAGKLLHVAIATRDFTGTRSGTYTWAEVAKGTFDAQLRAQARGIASIGKPVFLTYDQEASQKAKVARLGPNHADFVAAWRHVHDLFRAEGATNAIWVWVMTGSADNLGNAAKLWPGNDVVDWISWNVYNQSGCRGGTVREEQFVSFEDKMRIFYDFVHQDGPSLGMDATKPMMISETGSVRYQGNPTRTADWYAAIPSVLEHYPQIKAVTLWASTDTEDPECTYQFEDFADVVPGVRHAVTSGTVNARAVLLP